jgi:hypothetical protein
MRYQAGELYQFQLVAFGQRFSPFDSEILGGIFAPIFAALVESRNEYRLPKFLEFPYLQ